MTTGEWKSSGAYHRSLSAAAGTAAAGTAAAGTTAAIKVAPLGAFVSRALQEIQE